MQGIEPFPDVGGLELESEETFDNNRFLTYIVSSVDHPDQVVVKKLGVREYFSPEDPEKKVTDRHIYKTTSKRQKFLCVNGPLAGQFRTDEKDVRDLGYFKYNKSAYYRDKGLPSAVLLVIPS